MKGDFDIKKRIKDICNANTAVKLFFTAFLLVSFFTALASGGKYTELGFLQSFSLILWALALIASTLLLAAIEVFLGRYKLVEWLMLVSAFAYSLVLITDGKTDIQYRLYLALLIAFAIIINYLSGRGLFDTVPEKIDGKIKWGLISVFALTACAAVASIGVCRYLSFATPNFDFGIWCNMFHNMKESGLPVTTCERDGLLSHFAVHFSPIYYLMLPFYFVFPHPETLQILQAVILYSGVIPLCLLARAKGISDRATVVIGFIYSFYPAIATGTFYDLHENCFLLPLLLWCFFFFEKEKSIPMWIFAGLTLLVKEDAFIYLLIFSVYIFFLEGKKKTAAAVALVSIVYFVIVSNLMKNFGNGVMVGRYDNLIYDENDGLLGVVKTVILNPGYLLTQIFVSKDGDGIKLIYLVQLFFTLALIPLATKKIARYVLVVPVLMNLMTMYVYQPNIRFQYSFGITAFLFYVTVLNLSELGEKAKKFMLPMSAIATFLLFSMLVTGNFGYYVKRYEREKESYKAMENVLLEVLPGEASVVCSTFILPHIANRAEIYEVAYHKENGKYKTDTEYAVFDMRYKEESLKQADYFLKNGYEECYSGDNLLILKKK